MNRSLVRRQSTPPLAILNTLSTIWLSLQVVKISRPLRLPPLFPSTRTSQPLLPVVSGFVVHLQLEQQHHNHQQRRAFVSTTLPVRMPRGVKKENLPSKVCAVCNRPFTWRKKWERCWDEVTTCSKSCNNQRRLRKQQEQQQQKKSHEQQSCETPPSQPPPPVSPHQPQTPRSMATMAAATIEHESLGSFDDDDDDGVDRTTQDVGLEMLYDSRPDQQDLAELLSTTTSDNEDDDDESDSGYPKSPTFTPSPESIPVAACAVDEYPDPVQQKKAERKAAKKKKKTERRAQREGRGDPDAGTKRCDKCSQTAHLLIRCLYEEGQTDWKLVCGSCWKTCSGGVVDGDENHPHYRYGGLWKNRRRQQS